MPSSMVSISRQKARNRLYAGFVAPSAMNPAVLAADLAAQGHGNSAYEVIETSQTLALMDNA